eukprot:snap_masked-scaffold_1-processed-gene-29.9-mRNA-1 protein AED:1.00 eAED:1.00 QI:0/0/0/0/1/1/3/0/66
MLLVLSTLPLSKQCIYYTSAVNGEFRNVNFLFTATFTQGLYQIQLKFVNSKSITISSHEGESLTTC